MTKYKKILLVLTLLIFSNCGFQLTNLNTNFKIAEIKTSGDKKINYKIKNKVAFSSNKKNAELLKIKINTDKTKKIKEKNINNQITKYEISIITNVEFERITTNEKYNFKVNKTGDYTVSEKYSDTLNNEKKLVNTLVDNLTEEIIENIVTNLNDLQKL